MANEIVTARKGPVLEITLNRPEIGNAASDGMAVELTKLLLGAGESSEIVVLRGTGDDFCRTRSNFAAATTWCSTATAPSAAAKSR
jgi:enoyl-CoA hydratase/carnithine racemase